MSQLSREGESGGAGGLENIEEFNNKSEDEIILQYIHKKFRVNDVLQQRPRARAEKGEDSGGVIRTVKIKNSRDPTVLVPPWDTSSGGAVSVPLRKSVIVRRDEARTELEIQTDQMMISLNVEQLENLFTQEEDNFFQHSLANFSSNWQAISQGSEVMTMYCAFCQNPQTLSPRFMTLLTGQLRFAPQSSFSLLSSTPSNYREKLLCFMISTEEMGGLSQEKQFSLLKKALPEAIVMAKVSQYFPLCNPALKTN